MLSVNTTGFKTADTYIEQLSTKEHVNGLERKYILVYSFCGCLLRAGEIDTLDGFPTA